MERKTIRKWFWVWEFEKEEQWLNVMANSGWLLDGVGWCKYEFVACEPGAYTVRLEMRDHDENYLAFMQETGAEYVGRMAKWIFFRRKTELPRTIMLFDHGIGFPVPVVELADQGNCTCIGRPHGEMPIGLSILLHRMGAQHLVCAPVRALMK